MTKLCNYLLKSFGLILSMNSPNIMTEHSATAIDNVVTNHTDGGVSDKHGHFR